MKKILILPALVVAAGLIYTGIHYGSNSGSADTAGKPVVAGEHITKNSGNNKSTSNNSSNGLSLNSGALGYNLSVGPKPNSDIASNTTSGNNDSSNSNTTSNSSGTSSSPVTPPATTPVNPPVTPVSTVGANVIGNPSAEDSSGNPAMPTGWTEDGYGTNTPTYNYLNTGHTGGHSLQVSASAWTNGDVKWGFTPITVTAGTSYKFSDWYESTVATEVDADFVVNGVPTFLNLGSVPATTTWTQFSTEFTVPVGASSLVVYHILANVGSLTTDDYSLATYVPATFNRGIVTLNFDDGWLSQYQNAFPLLQADGLPATFFIITDSSLTNPDPDYMNATQILQLQAAGEEIGNHTETHPDLTTLTTAQVQTEMGGAQSALEAIGITPTDFAYPFGAYNASTIAVGQSVGFVSQRSVVSGFNSKDTLDFTQLKIEEVDADISTAQVQAWVDQAIAQKTWLILVWHEVDTVAPAGSGDEAYLTSPANLETELSYIKASGVAVETTAQAVAEVSAQ